MKFYLKGIFKRLKIKDCFGKLHALNISGRNIQYIPVIHIPKYKKINDYYFPEQTLRLESFHFIKENSQTKCSIM